jgi:hypothetical protein
MAQSRLFQHFTKTDCRLTNSAINKFSQQGTTHFACYKAIFTYRKPYLLLTIFFNLVIPSTL